jgi:hypothetical protein
VVRDELHLGTRGTATRTALTPALCDPSAGLAAPLLGERLDEDAALHVQANYFNLGARPEFTL